MRYIRFVIPRPYEGSHRRAGVFMAAFEHWTREDIEPELCDRLGMLFDWFGDNLLVPSIAEPRAVFCPARSSS